MCLVVYVAVFLVSGTFWLCVQEVKENNKINKINKNYPLPNLMSALTPPFTKHPGLSYACHTLITFLNRDSNLM